MEDEPFNSSHHIYLWRRRWVKELITTVGANPTNIRLDEDVLKKSGRRLGLHLQKASSRRLDQDEYICLGVGDKSSRHLQGFSPRRLQTSWRRSGEILKTSSRCIGKTSLRYLQNVFKTSWKYVFKTSSRHFQDESSS